MASHWTRVQPQKSGAAWQNIQARYSRDEKSTFINVLNLAVIYHSLLSDHEWKGLALPASKYYFPMSIQLDIISSNDLASRECGQ